MQDWFNGTHPNNGVFLKQASPEDTNNVLYFYSSNSADAWRWPKLTITYGVASLSVQSWSADPETGAISHDFTASASGLAVEGDPNGPCHGSFNCRWALQTMFVDGSTVVQGGLGSDLLPAGTTSFSKRFNSPIVGEITDI